MDWHELLSLSVLLAVSKLRRETEMTRMALSKAHTSVEAADVAKLLLLKVLNKRGVWPGHNVTPSPVIC